MTLPGPRQLAEAALDLVLPRTCPGCFAPVPWCASCDATLLSPPPPVALPADLLDRWAASGIPAVTVRALARYRGPIRAAIIAAKERNRRDLARPLGVALAQGIAQLVTMSAVPNDLWLVPAPTRRAAARLRGGDPVLAMARHAARTLALVGMTASVAPCLVLRRGTRDSVGLSVGQRAQNLAHAVTLDPDGRPPAQAHIVLIDDVFTTGATALASIQALYDAGLTVESVVVLASAAPLP